MDGESAHGNRLFLMVWAYLLLLTAVEVVLAYIHVFSPCPTGWRVPPSMLIEVARKAVQTNMVPLWEYEKDDGRIRLTHTVDDPLPVQAYLSLIGKYRHLDDAQIAHIQKRTDEAVERLKRFGPDDAAALSTDAA